MLKKLTGNYTSTAKVVDGTLILSLPDAVSPVVWRMDLGFVRASAIEIREQKDGTYMLFLKTPKEDVNEIAPFASKAKALHALMALSDAMKHAHGEIRQPASSGTATDQSGPAYTHYSPKKGLWGKIATGLLAVILLFFFINIVIGLTPPPPQNFPVASNSSTAPSQTRQSPAGVPLSADDFLSNRR